MHFNHHPQLQPDERTSRMKKLDAAFQYPARRDEI